jgi:hypothetical protein
MAIARCRQFMLLIASSIRRDWLPLPRSIRGSVFAAYMEVFLLDIQYEDPHAVSS